MISDEQFAAAFKKAWESEKIELYIQQNFKCSLHRYNDDCDPETCGEDRLFRLEDDVKARMDFLFSEPEVTLSPYLVTLMERYLKYRIKEING